MRRPAMRIPMEIIDDPDITPDLLFLWSRLEVLRMRQSSNVVETGTKHARLVRLTGMQPRKITRLLREVCELGYAQVAEDCKVTLIAGTKSVPESQETSVVRKTSSTKQPPCPTPSTAQPTTSARKQQRAANEEVKAFTARVVDAWNEFAVPRKLPTCSYDRQDVVKHMPARMQDPEWQGDFWPPMLERLKRLKPHWMGESEAKWRISLPYLVRSRAQAQKLLAGEWSLGEGETAAGQPETYELPLVKAPRIGGEETPW